MCLTLCDPMDCSPPVSSVQGVLQARVPEWVATSFSRASSQPRNWTRSPALQADSLQSEPPCKPIQPTAAATAKSHQLCPTLCNPIDTTYYFLQKVDSGTSTLKELDPQSRSLTHHPGGRGSNKQKDVNCFQTGLLQGIEMARCPQRNTCLQHTSYFQ